MKTAETKNSSDASHVTTSVLNAPEKASFFSTGKQKSSHLFGPHFIQPKLKIGRSNDKYEQEADHVADQVMRMPETSIQRKCEECEKEEKLQKKPEVKASASCESVVGTGLSSQIKSQSGSGSPLPKHVSSEMGHKMNTDFSGVNIHTDSKAAEMNQQLGAKAFTHGSDIYFNQGQYNPSSSEGKHLLAHELTHVRQQNVSTREFVQRACEIGGENNKQQNDWTPTLHRGNKGPMVRKLQKLLQDDGIDIGEDGVDGIYGGDTESAVKVFQKKYDLNVDGVVGDDTWDKIHAEIGMFFTVEEVNAFQASDSGTSETMTFTIAEAQAPPPLPGDFCAPLHSVKQGAYYYGKRGSDSYMAEAVQKYAEKKRAQNYPAMAQGAELFFKLVPLEGGLSAINTYDNKVLTWGPGFAHNGGLDTVWEKLDSSVKKFLAYHAPTYFGGSSISVGENEEIRKDADALSALVYVAEHDPYRELVLKAMIEAFLKENLGISGMTKKGEELPGGSFDRARILAVRLEHWLPAFMQIPGDLNFVDKEYGNDKTDDQKEGQVRANEVKAATELMVRFGERFLKSNKGRDRKSGGRIQDKVGYRVVVKFQRGLREYFGSFNVPNKATNLFPGFIKGKKPYFEFYDSEQKIDQGNDVLVHYVKGKENRYVDMGKH